jgi:hypothetical protein
MNPSSIYINLLKEKGQPLLDRNLYPKGPIALTVDNAVIAIKSFEGTDVAVLGGDIISESKDSRLVYAYTIWGDGYEYHNLDWSCDPFENESKSNFATRSHKVAMDSIYAADKVAKRLGQKCYIVLVVR